MQEKTLGDQELALLRYVASNAPASAGEINSGFGEPNGLARSTIETVLERLRKKGFLKRSKTANVFRYEPTTAPQELMLRLVEQFVEKTLEGSHSPLIAYFSKTKQLTPGEVQELERLIRKLEAAAQEES